MTVWKCLQGALGVVGIVACTAHAHAASPWSVIGDPAHYVLDGGGDVQSERGASLTVYATPEADTRFGGGTAVIDATPYREKRVRLTGRISTQAVSDTAGIWLRADAASGRVAFANSERNPVTGNAADVVRQVEIYVPAVAERLLVGPLLIGKGRMSVRELRLEQAPPSPDDGVPPARIVEDAVRHVRAHALYADRIDWDRTQADIASRVQRVHTADAAYDLIRSLLAQLGDRHSGVLPPSDVRRSATEGVPSFVPRVEVRERVGIVAVPGFSGTEQAASLEFARDLATAIADRAASASCGWIVDLRGNSGGNMWPMLSGLHPLLGEATVGYMRDRDGRQNAWRIAPPGVTAPDLSAVPVVVVTGAKTASSGEAVAVAFRGRAHTRSMGQATMGVSTGNQLFPVLGGAALKLTTTRFVDRTGHAYGEPLAPDEEASEADAVARAVQSLAGCAG